MKVLDTKIVNGKKLYLIDEQLIKAETGFSGNFYYVPIQGINSSDNLKTKFTTAKQLTKEQVEQLQNSPTSAKNIAIKEALEKTERLKKSEQAYKKRQETGIQSSQDLADETGAIGDKISLQKLPIIGNYIPEELDVTKIIGDMASSLGRLPLNLERGNYGQAALSVAMPLGVGALAGVGTENTGQFVNNIVNPLAGTGELINNLGNKYLPNAYKLNPWAFKPNPEMMYRGIGKEGMEDALESGVFRAKQNVQPSLYGGFDLSKEFKSTYYTPKFNTADQYGKGFIAEVPKDVTPFRLRYKGKGNKTWSQIADENVPIEKGRILQKDWLRRYKEVPKPQQTFKSEIDWSKWNKEIPENKALMQEYNVIEQQTKANGTWMKNPDGSPFQGSPEQFVQQNSQNFKKAFGNSKLVNPDGSPTIQYHGSAKKFDAFDESKFQLGDSGYSGVGIYTTPSKSTAQSYAMSSSSFHSGKIEPTVYELYGQANNPISSSQLIKENKGRDLFNFHRKNNWKGELTPEESLMEFDAAIADQLPNVERIRPWNDAREIVFPSNKQLKSAIGNNGMFDMTNPNIYKTIVGGLATGTLGKEAMRKKEFGGKIKILKTKISNGKTLHLIED